ncbi:hypothetical protein [Neotabrizicola sp. sgz301269]|uniref:hypothetical protein n=1 Tax=Neotabrizicola sp. sgz301269 TaxID=3276282 RepID=UPI00376F47DC
MGIAEIQNEKTRYLSAALQQCSVACFAAGFATPIFAQLLDVARDMSELGVARVGFGLILWVIAGFVLYSLGLHQLGNLIVDDES